MAADTRAAHHAAPTAALDDDALLAALGVESTPPQAARHTPQQERLIAGFEDILRFHRAHSRAPQHGEGRDMFERLYAVRLERLRQLPEAHALLAALDAPGLLSAAPAPAAVLDEDALLAALGVGEGAQPGNITTLSHVRSASAKRAAEDMAERHPCADFEHFAPRFEQAERELKAGVRQALRFGRDTAIAEGHFFILGGQMAYVAQVGEPTKTTSGHDDARLRLIYGNATESNLLLRSLQKALYKDDTGRRLSEPHVGPLFGDVAEPDDLASGTLYVLRSHSTHPFMAEHRELIHKIGITGGSVQARIAGAEKDPTYLLAPVEVVATYQLHNLHRTKLENLFHRLFAAARLDLCLPDRFGHAVQPQEWFVVPLSAIDEAVQRIRHGSIAGMRYDPAVAALVAAT